MSAHYSYYQIRNIYLLPPRAVACIGGQYAPAPGSWMAASRNPALIAALQKLRLYFTDGVSIHGLTE